MNTDIVFLTGYFNSQKDPQRKVVVKADNPDLMMLSRSAASYNISTYVYTDCLSDSFREEETTKTNGSTKFLSATPRSDRSLNVGRFYLYRDWLSHYQNYVNTVYICDLFDVKVNINPTNLFNQSNMYFSVEYNSQSHYRNNASNQSGKWLRDVMMKAYGEVPSCTHDKPIVCAGVFGGKSSLVAEFVNDMCDEFDKLNVGMKDIDMGCFNKLYYEKYEQRNDCYAVGSPLVSPFKEFKNDAKCCFIHK